MKQFLKENWFKLIIAGCAVLISVGYLWSINIEQHRENRLTPSPWDKENPGELDFRAFKEQFKNKPVPSLDLNL